MDIVYHEDNKMSRLNLDVKHLKLKEEIKSPLPPIHYYNLTKGHYIQDHHYMY